MSRTAVLLVSLLSFSLTALAAEHNPLLPRPQNVQYGSGKLAIKNLKIHLNAAPSDEDRFAAGELVAILAARGGGRNPVVEGAAQGPAITLVRTGNADPLPVPDEKPGPESREAYSIKVTPVGAEVRARSSAGFYFSSLRGACPCPLTGLASGACALAPEASTAVARKMTKQKHLTIRLFILPPPALLCLLGLPSYL